MWRDGHDEMRRDGLRKGRNDDTGFATRDMARRVKWADPALRRERERERTLARGSERSESENERRTLARGSERSENENERERE